MSTTSSATPTETQDAPAPVAPVAPDPAGDDQPEREESTREYSGDDSASRGIPAAHLAVGGAAGGTVGLGALYQLTGTPGLVAGGALAAAGVVAYVRYRRGGGRDRSGSSWHGSTSRTGGKSAGSGGLLGGRSGPHRTSALFSPGRTGLRGSGAGGGARAGRTAGRTRGAASSAGSRTATQGGPIRQATARVRQAATGTADAARTAARGTATAAQGVARAARQAAGWVGRATGGRARRVVSAAGRAARRAAIYADRATGRRVSTAYRAASTGRDRSFAARRRRAAAVLGWHGPVTGAVLALVAALVEAWGKARKKAATETTTKTDETAEGAAETASSESTPEATPEDSQDRPADGAPAETTQTTATGQDRPRRTHTPPTGTGTGAYMRRTRTMSANPLAAAAAEVNSAAASYAPRDMWQVARDLDLLHEVPANVAMAIRTYTMRLQGEYPIDPSVVEALGELYMAHAALVEIAQEIARHFRRVHADDLRREESPRPGEPLWNV